MCKVYSYTPTKYFGSNMFLIEADSEYAIVDPSIPYNMLIELLDGRKIKIKYVLVTHSHFDHILKIDSYAAEGAEVIVGREDADGLADSYLNCYAMFCGVDKGYHGKYTAATESDEFSLGNEVIRIINTPGHTRGGVSYLISSNLFVGDTVFNGGNYGRCDFPGGDFATLQSSIKSIMCLPDETRIYSGHGPDTTVKNVRKHFL